MVKKFQLSWTVLYKKGHKNNFLYNKTVQLSAIFSSGPDFEWSKQDGYHSKSGQNGPVIEWFLNTGPFEFRTHIDHSKSGLVRYSDGNCTFLNENTVGI